MKKYLKVFVFGIFAGLAIGLGSFVFTISKYFNDTYLNGSKIGLIIASALFSIGLILVCTLKLQLYTGKIGVVLDDKARIKENAINLPIMLIGNAVGAFLLGIICHLVYMNSEGVMKTIEAIAKGKINTSIAYVQGILCGGLVYIAVYFFKNLENYAMKIIGIITAVTLFVYCGFQHCIANMFYFGMAFKFDAESFRNILVIIIANSIGAFIVRFFVYFGEIIGKKKKAE